MNPMKRFVLGFLCITMLPIATTLAYNTWNDTSGLFNTDFSQPRPEPAQHFVKMRYLIAHPDKYDAYCFGSSRVGNIDLKKIDDGYRYYNMTYAMGVPADWLGDLKILLAHHVTIRRVMLGLDESFQIMPPVHEGTSLFVPYRENNFKTYLNFLFRMPSKPYRWEDRSKDPDMYHNSLYDIYDSGRPLHDAPDQRIDADPDAHRQAVANKVAGMDFHQSFPDQVEQTLAELQEIKNICDANGIDLIVFINPIEHGTYLSADQELFRKFRTGLAKITPYYDFSGLNYITLDDYYYYETIHYRPIVGDQIIHRIFQIPKHTETNFGKYVEQVR